MKVLFEEMIVQGGGKKKRNKPQVILTVRKIHLVIQNMSASHQKAQLSWCPEVKFSLHISSSLAWEAKGLHQCIKVLQEGNGSTAMCFFKRNAVAVGKFRAHLNSNSFSRRSRVSFEVCIYEHIWSWSISTHIHQKGMRVGGIHKTTPKKGSRKKRE